MLDPSHASLNGESSMEPGTSQSDGLPSALYVFIDREDNTVLAALQEGRANPEPLPMLIVDEELLPRYVQLARAYGCREGRSYRLFRFESCVEVDMNAIAPVRRSSARREMPGGLLQ